MPPTVRERERERNILLVRRAWTRTERRVVVNGLLGRLVIAIEPLICCIVFTVLTAGLIFFPLPASAKLTHREAAIVLSPIFGLMALAFCAYAVSVLVAPVRALMHTFSPIFIIDGYVRYRRPDRESEPGSNGYIAVLGEDRRAITEWVSLGEVDLPDSVRPAMIEFSHYGGIHRIDGRSTGVLPDAIPPLGIGIRS